MKFLEGLSGSSGLTTAITNLQGGRGSLGARQQGGDVFCLEPGQSGQGAWVRGGQFQVAWGGGLGGWLLEHSVLMSEIAFSAKSQATSVRRPTTQSSRRGRALTLTQIWVLVHAGCVKLPFFGWYTAIRTRARPLLLSRSQLTHLPNWGE